MSFLSALFGCDPKPIPNLPKGWTGLDVFATNYWLLSLDDKAGWAEYHPREGEPETTAIEVVGPTGISCRTYPTTFLRAVRMEGSGKVGGGVLNYDGKTWRLIDGERFPYGQTASGYPAVPFFTIAVDPKMIPMKTLCFIPELVGFVKPDGVQHTGWVRSDDTGGAIKGCHIDLHVGTKKDRIDNLFSKVKIQWRVNDELA